MAALNHIPTLSNPATPDSRLELQSLVRWLSIRVPHHILLLTILTSSVSISPMLQVHVTAIPLPCFSLRLPFQQVHVRFSRQLAATPLTRLACLCAPHTPRHSTFHTAAGIFHLALVTSATHFVKVPDHARVPFLFTYRCRRFRLRLPVLASLAPVLPLH